MRVILSSFKKELCEVLRDKRTLMLTVLVPMIFYPALIMLAGGLGAKQQIKEQQREIKVGVHFSNTSDASDEIADHLIHKLELAEKGIHWSITEKENEEIESLLDKGEFDLIIESDYVSNSSSEKAKPNFEMTIHYFSTARGETDIARVKKALHKVKTDIVVKEMGKVIEVKALKDYASVRERTGSKYGGMAAYFLVFLAFTGCMAVAVDVAAGEKERGTLEAMLVTPASFYQISMGKLLFIVIMGLLSVLSTTLGIGAMVLIAGDAMKGMSLSGVGFTSILGIIILLIVLVFFFAVILFSLSLLARSSKEAHMRSSLLMLFIAMALVYCTLPGIELSSELLAIPVLNVALALRALWEGTLTVTDYTCVIGSLIALSSLIVWLVSKRVKNDAEKVLLK